MRRLARPSPAYHRAIPRCACSSTAQPPIIVTTATDPTPQMLSDAQAVSERLSAPLVPRHDASKPSRRRTVKSLIDSHGADFAYVVARVNGPHGSQVARHEIRRNSDGRTLHVHPRQWNWMTKFRSSPLARAICDEDEPRHPRVQHTELGCPRVAVAWWVVRRGTGQGWRPGVAPNAKRRRHP